jgi:hypothetical protein
MQSMGFFIQENHIINIISGRVQWQDLRGGRVFPGALAV